MLDNSIILQIYLAQRHIFKIYHSNEEIQKALTKVTELENKIKDIINNNPQLVQLFDELQNAKNDYDDYLEKNAFSVGFKTGFKLALETTED